jgi:hypothetical protein
MPVLLIACDIAEICASWVVLVMPSRGPRSLYRKLVLRASRRGIELLSLAFAHLNWLPLPRYSVITCIGPLVKK